MTTTADELDDTERADLDATMAHLNGNHADTVLLVARHLAQQAVDAELARVDRLGATFVIQDASSVASEVTLVFPSPLGDAHEAQTHLFAAMSEARAELDPSAPLTSLELELQVTASLRTVHGRVAGVRRVNANLLEITLAGFDDYPLVGGDEFVYAMVSHEPGGIPPCYGMDQYRDQAPDDPVRGAYYTVRRSRPDVGEIDLWVVEHDHPGSVAAWMMTCVPGDPIALWGPRRGFTVPGDAQHVLFVADETGFAAVAATIECLSAGIRATAVLECIDDAHRPPMPTHAGLEVIWVARCADEPGVINRLLAACMSLADRPDAAFGAAESRQISAVRRYVRSELGMSASSVSMTGYWRRNGE